MNLKMVFWPWAEIARLRRDCAEAYQVVGSLATFPLPFEHPDVSRALDNLYAATSGHKRPHEDLLPFPKDETEKTIADDKIKS